MFINVNKEIKKSLYYLEKDYYKLLKKIKKYSKKYNKCTIIELYYIGMYKIIIAEYSNEAISNPLKSSLDTIGKLQKLIIEMISVLDDIKRNPSNYMLSNVESKNNKSFFKNVMKNKKR